MNQLRKFFIIAGEVSGDIHGALLMDAMKQADPTCKFSGIGGHQMRFSGLSSLFPLEQLSVMGFVEVLKHLYLFKQILDFYLDNQEELDNWNKGGGKEQTILNYHLVKNNITPTKQRLDLAEIIFVRNQHFTAADLINTANESKLFISQAESYLF